MIFHSQRCVARRVVSVLCRFSHNSKMAALPTAAKGGPGGGLKRAAIIIVGDEILKGETQVFTTTANPGKTEKYRNIVICRGKLTTKNFLSVVCSFIL
jgi:hypothetical protein